MLEANSRRVYFGDVVLNHFLYYSPKSNQALQEKKFNNSSFDLRYFMQMAKECLPKAITAVPAKSAVTEPSKESEDSVEPDFNQFLTIQAIDLSEKYAVVLFDAINPGGADIAYKNSVTKAQRIINKNNGEGNNYSSHMVIKLDGKDNTYPACLEVVTNLGHTTINAIFSRLNGLVRKRNGDNFKVISPVGEMDKNGKPLLRSFRTQIGFTTIPSNDFWNMIGKQEALLELTLISNRPAFDSNTPVSPKKKLLCLERPQNNFFNCISDSMKLLSNWANINRYDQILVRFKDVDKYDRTVYIDTANMALNADKYIKSATITVQHEKLATAYKGINNEVVAAMWRILTK